MTESPLKNIFEMYRSLFTGLAFFLPLPVFGTSVQTSFTCRGASRAAGARRPSVGRLAPEAPREVSPSTTRSEPAGGAAGTGTPDPIRSRECGSLPLMAAF